MPRSMWRGAISFGMVAIPVRMYLATESRAQVHFRLLCPSCHRPIKNRRFCPFEDVEVGWSDTLRGYEVSKDEFVIIDDADLDRVPLPTSQAIEILEFVEDSDIDATLYVQQAYYLEPEKVGMKPYKLLRDALGHTGRVAIGRIAFRDREHLVRLALHGDEGLVLTTLHWPDEIRDMGELTLPGNDVSVQKAELDMAVMLIESLASRFDPARHSDRYRQAVLAIVEEKMGTREAAPVASSEPPQVMDLMAALKASLEAARAERGDQADAGAAAGADTEPVPAPRTRRRSEASSADATAEAHPSRRRRAS